MWRRASGEIVAQASSRGLLSSEHFTVDGTLIEAWASRKSFWVPNGLHFKPLASSQNKITENFPLQIAIFPQVASWSTSDQGLMYGQPTGC
jgi:hypothetical protein